MGKVIKGMMSDLNRITWAKVQHLLPIKRHFSKKLIYNWNFFHMQDKICRKATEPDFLLPVPLLAL